MKRVQLRKRELMDFLSQFHDAHRSRNMGSIWADLYSLPSPVASGDDC